MPGTIGPYRIDGVMGRGGMGVVYDAWDDRLRRRVAIKRMRSEREDSRSRARMEREARAVARLNHPAIVQVFDVLEVEGDLFIVMEKVEGRTLAQLLREGPIEPERWSALFREIAEGMAEAHGKGLIHRDLKTENVMVTAFNHAKILDFGLAKAFWPGSGQIEPESGVRSPVGTHRAMSPEQATQRDLDPRSDLFALGVLFYETMSGISPFHAETPLKTLDRVLNHHPAPVAERNPLVPEALSELVDQLLEKDRDRRPRSATEVVERLSVIDQQWSRGSSGHSDPLDGETYGYDDSEYLEDTYEPLSPGDATPEDSASGPVIGGDSVPERVSPSPRRWPTALLVALLLGVSVFLFDFWRSGMGEPVYVWVAEPEIGLGEDEASARWAAAGLRTALVRSLLALEGAVPLTLDTERREPGGVGAGLSSKGPRRRIAQTLAADEILSSRLDCLGSTCQVSVERSRVDDGKISTHLSFEAPADDFELLATATRTYLQRLFSDLGVRRGFRELSFRGDDYERFLRLQQQTYSRERSLDEILTELAEIRAGSPRFLEAYLLEAEVAGLRFHDRRQPVDRDHALDMAHRAQEMAPWDPRPLIARFSIAFSAGLIDSAREAVADLERSAPGDQRIPLRRSLLLEYEGDLDGATEVLTRAVERRPSLSNFVALANLQYRRGAIDAMRATLGRLLERFPDQAYGLALLAQMELMSGSAEEAARLYQRLSANEESFIDLSNLGLAQMLLGRFGEAVRAFEGALALSPDHAGAHLNLADGLWLNGRREPAEEHYRAALRLATEDPAAEHWQTQTVRAQALAHLGRVEEAVESAQRALLAAPENPQVAYEVTLVYALVGEQASAVVNARRALEGGVDRRWFSFPWFDELRQRQEVKDLMAPSSEATPPNQ